MIRKSLILILSATTLLFCEPGYSQKNGDYNYSSLTIADSLKKNAHTIFRLDEAILEVKSPSRYVQKVHQIVTILNQEGESHLRHVLGFDKFVKINEVQIKVYNSLGILDKKYNKSDFDVRKAYDGVSFITDDKVMRLVTPAPGYPCTVETIYEMEVNSYIELPDWYVGSDKVSTEIFRYIVKVPADPDIRYRSRNMDLKPDIKIDGSQKIYTWEKRNIPARSLDEHGYEYSAYAQSIEVAPNVFEYDGYKGEFKTWKDFGKWNYSLYEQKNPFDERRSAEIRSLADSKQELKDKVSILYDYLKSNMRYVSIQLGIGGFKPFDVKFVDEKKYGDCKALTNYMRGMLSVAGIKSYPALINAGFNELPADPAFPSSTFNHVILCVPAKDTIWLECTSNNNSAGFLGSFTENKNALLLTEDGGKLVKTPASSYRNSKLYSRVDIKLDEEGGAKVDGSIYTSGDIHNLFSEIKLMGSDKQKEIFVGYLDYKHPDEFSFTPARDSAGGSKYRVELAYDRLYDFNAGTKYFFPQRINKLCDENLETKERTAEYLFQFPYEKRDTTVFHLPEAYTIDNLPANKELDNEIASYKRQILSDPSSKTISVVSSLVLKKHIVPVKDFKKVAELFTDVNKDEGQKIVMKKN